MPKIESSYLDIGYLDTLSCQHTFVHALDPRVKLLTTLVFVVTVLSFNKYEITGLIPFLVFPVAMIAAGNLPAGYLMRKVVMAAPFAFFVGVFNPLLDRGILVHLGTVEISGGWVSFASILLRFVLSVSAALTLIATTGLNAVCMAMEKLGAPRVFAVQLLLLYRYLFVLIDEALRVVRARSLRSFGTRRPGVKGFGTMVGPLLLRTVDRAQRIHIAMLSRGFDGEIRILRPLRIRGRDAAFLVGWTAAFVLMRIYDVPQWLGRLGTEMMK
jgi:cobalt/nickel transport system permease protein